jgi:hypothetical protein
MNDSPTSAWKVEYPRGGRDGYLGYYEGSCAASFFWELGGNDVVLIIHIGTLSEWSRQHPWAAERRQEIIGRVAADVIRQSAPNYMAEIEERDDGYTYLLIRKKPPA